MEENVHKRGMIFIATAQTLDTWEGPVIIVSIHVLKNLNFSTFFMSCFSKISLLVLLKREKGYKVDMS